ncbi:phage holin family protein [Azohydromonas sp.]|mgnify:CR=1 FL=1|uniref:phage holin family protein n=1 Tax=Azohydromonas sp. TaxID=1872666 RepID=UPI002C10D630|nr:phage holin family protein [Azohydromonas sp.]HMM87045.1 phage holin family protein [Azohydromonas sp.]
MSDGAPRPPGLFASLRRVLGSAAELVEVRLELLATELQQEKLRVLEALAWLAVAMLAFGIAMVLLAVFVVLLFDEHRLAALGAVVLVYLGGAALAWRAARARLREGGGPFEASLAELRRDRAALAGRDPGASA